MVPFASEIPTVTSPPFCVYLMALWMRFSIAKCEADVFGPGRFFQEADGDPDRIAHIAGFDIKLEGAVRYARNVQEVVGDRHHVVGCARALFCNLALLGPKR